MNSVTVGRKRPGSPISQRRAASPTKRLNVSELFVECDGEGGGLESVRDVHRGARARVGVRRAESGVREAPKIKP